MRNAVLVALTFAVLAGCTKPATSSLGARHSWTQPHVLRIADISDPDHLNPYLSEMDLSYDLSSLIYSFLVIADARGRLIGDLAVRVPSLANGDIARDGRTYTYRLRRGVLWHDGVRFTSRDVVASWRAVMNPRNDTFEHEGYDRVARIETPDEFTVVVRLRERYPPFVSRFFAPLQEGGKPVLPAHVLERERDFNAGELSAHPIGTGPFEFVAWARGDRIVLQRFERYFKGRPHLTRVELRIIPNDQTVAVALQEHQLDLIVAPQTSLLDQYRATDGVTVESAPWNSQAALMIDARKPALHELAVRRAIAVAIPYGVILRNVTRDLYPQARNSLPPTALGYEQLPARRYDPAAAARLLDSAGWHAGPDGVRTRNGLRLALTLVTIAGATNFERMALLLQSAFRAAGIDLTIKTYPYRTIFAAPSGPIYGGAYDLALYSDTVNWDPDVYNFTACDRWYPFGQNIFRFCDARLDALERAGLQTDDPATRATTYRAASRLMWSLVPYVPIYNGRRLIVRSSDLRNYSVNPTSTPWWNAYQWDI
ncbi:MAG: peptide ABC transporter substrate-binding protein [Candidatus Eremiobacteraeota bacterium]|nr:peptide ABC transporter substrate-binding protein [Candidatus Eremiobacteraeota bacterium]MBV8372916.1 peptide ABC transporter substrate-binding protein [Candidatus Eremiobacteraeota bacterium]